MTDTLTLTERRVLGAFKLAMRELGVHEHPAGQCPDKPKPCSCSGLELAIEKRATALVLDDPYFADAQVCEDCHVLIPIDANCYVIDCGNVVCPPCGERRGLTDDYKLGPWERADA